MPTNQNCPNCGSNKHNFRELSAENRSQCRAFGKTCNNCGRPNHFSNVCRSRPAQQQSKTENKVDHQSMAVLYNLSSSELFEKHQLGNISADAKSRRRFLGHVKYDNDLERFIPIQLKQSNTINVDILFDPKNHVELGGNVHGRDVLGKQSYEAIADTGAAICCTVHQLQK